MRPTAVMTRAVSAPQEGADPVVATLDALMSYLRGRPEMVAPIAVPEPEAARMCGVSYKLLSEQPAEEVGRARIGRRVVYEVARLREFIRNRIAK